jgi:prefoldin subunit 5
MEGEQVVGLRTMARMRSEVRELEAEKSEFDRLIAALDRRFSALWSRQG